MFSSNKLNLVPTDTFQAIRDQRTVDTFDADMRKRATKDAMTPNVQFFPGFAFVDKRPIDAEIADGKKQRVFYNQNQYYGLAAAKTSANAVFLGGIRPIESRSFNDDF